MAGLLGQHPPEFDCLTGLFALAFRFVFINQNCQLITQNYSGIFYLMLHFLFKSGFGFKNKQEKKNHKLDDLGPTCSAEYRLIGKNWVTKFWTHIPEKCKNLDGLLLCLAPDKVTS